MPADEDEDCMLPDDEGVLGPPEAPCVRLVVAFNFIHGKAAAQSDAAGVRSSWLVLLSMEDRERGQ
jgi:hypothetical protein